MRRVTVAASHLRTALASDQITEDLTQNVISRTLIVFMNPHFLIIIGMERLVDTITHQKPKLSGTSPLLRPTTTCDSYTD